MVHTPGHRPGHIALLQTDTTGADAPMGIFTGDFVFAGDVGRPDLLEKVAGIGNTAEPGARRMFQSLQRFKQRPEYVQVWPAHGLPTPERLPFTRLPALLKAGAVVVDTRSASAFAAGHIRGAINLPFDGSFTTWAGWLLDYKTPFYLIADTATMQGIVRDLLTISLDHVASYAETVAQEAAERLHRMIDSLWDTSQAREATS